MTDREENKYEGLGMQKQIFDEIEGTIFVLSNRENEPIQESGYCPVLLGDVTKWEPEQIGEVYEEWSLQQKVLLYILAHSESECIGICLQDVYFLEQNRLLSVAAMKQLLSMYDVVLPDKECTSEMPELTSSILLFTRRIAEAYISQLAVQEKPDADFLMWIKMHNMYMACQRVEKIDINRLPKMYRLIEQLTGPLVEKYRRGEHLLLERIHPSVGRDGRMPIWICWWQGIEQAPAIVKKCVESIYKNMPSDRVDIHIITLDNYEEYIHLPDTIRKRWEDGMITMTHLSDILRAQLLCRYGGLWMDATCLLWDDRFAESLLQYPFFTRKQGGANNELDIVSGRWATYFVKGPANFPLFGFWVEAFEKYWEKYDTLLNYFIFDYITAVAYDNLPEVKMILDAVPVNNAASEVLAHWCNYAFQQDKMDLLTQDTWLFKMTYKMQLQEKTPQKEDTFFHAVMTR